MRTTLFVGAIFVASLSVPHALAASVDVSVQGATTGIVVYSGTADVCNLSGSSCSSVGAGCGAASVSGEGVDLLAEDAKAGFVAANFPFAVNQEILDGDFQAGTGVCFMNIDIPSDTESRDEESRDEPPPILGSPS